MRRRKREGDWGNIVWTGEVMETRIKERHGVGRGWFWIKGTLFYNQMKNNVHIYVSFRFRAGQMEPFRSIIIITSFSNKVLYGRKM